RVSSSPLPAASGLVAMGLRYCDTTLPRAGECSTLYTERSVEEDPLFMATTPAGRWPRRALFVTSRRPIVEKARRGPQAPVSAGLGSAEPSIAQCHCDPLGAAHGVPLRP